MKKVALVKIPQLHPQTWTSDLLEGKLGSNQFACTVLCGCWAIWSERNARNHGENERSMQASVRWALESAVDVTIVGKESRPTVTMHTVLWQPPEKGTLKINVDASFFEYTRCGCTCLGI